MTTLPTIEHEELTYEQLMDQHGHDSEILHRFLIFMNKRRNNMRAIKTEAHKEVIVMRNNLEETRGKTRRLTEKAKMCVQ